MSERERDEQKEQAPALQPRLTHLLCKRTGQKIAPGEHERCPYCFSRLAVIERGRHEAFCDYREGVDPLNFGFPADEVRSRRG